VHYSFSDLNGTVPSELAALSTLGILGLNANNLYGTLPSELGLLDRLFYFSMDQNMLTGTIPNEIADLQLLRSIILYDNMLTGTIPPNILGKDESVLVVFEVSLNELTGTIPPLRPQSGLEYFNVDKNQLTGTIPGSLYAQPSLLQFRVADNKLNGTIAEQIDGLAGATEIVFSNNAFTGSLPARLGNLPLVKDVRFSHNKFTGPIPGAWSGLRDIEMLDLSENDLTGTIPEGISSRWAVIDSFTVDSNPMLSGAIPLSFSDIPHLKEFDLVNTNFTSGLEEAFCAQPILSTTISADCGGAVPRIECSCCSTCCDASDGSCNVNLVTACNAHAGSLVVDDPSRGTVCNCNEDLTVVSCNDSEECVSCNSDMSDPNTDTQCGINTDYGYVLDPVTGDIIGFQNTLVHTSGPWAGTTIRYYDDVTTPTFDFYVNGEKCVKGMPFYCPSNFRSFLVDCSNLEDGYFFHPCESDEAKEDYGYLNILFALDPASSFGCGIQFTQVNPFA
jgi:hypothetical protein